ncbi:hypothetical protein K3495_g13429 [Podosphaera aphanis]|nr:hypothetical protein K3495_g13429 [Podosphaera aphanis]
MSDLNPHPSTSEQPSRPQMPQEQPSQPPQPTGVNLSGITAAQYQAIRNIIIAEISNQNALPPPPVPHTVPSPIPNTIPHIPQSKHPSKWPVWDGSVLSFDSHVFLLRIKIEEDRNILGSNRAICFDIFRSIPTDKQPRILHWLETGGPDRNFDWEQFLKHLKDQFENKQARQTAADLLGRMRMGANQYFTDFFQEYELKLSQCGGTEWTDSTKIMHLEIGIKAPLRQLLMNKNLPDDDYTKWATKVKRVAGRLQNSPSYRPHGCSGKKHILFLTTDQPLS